MREPAILLLLIAVALVAVSALVWFPVSDQRTQALPSVRYVWSLQVTR